MSKKTRGPNFSYNEKEVLIGLVEKHKSIVENKKTDAVTTTMKNEGWKEICNEFNSISTFCVRNTEQLRTCWDNIKRNTRKDKATSKRQLFLTGGGRPDMPPPGPLQGHVEALLGPTLDGLDNPYDTDAQFTDQLMSNVEVITDAEIQVDDTAGPSKKADSSEDINLPPERSEKAWDTWTPVSLKSKISNALSVDKKKDSWLHRRRPKTSLQDQVLQNKLDLLELWKINTQREAKIKEEILQEQLKQEKLKTEKLKIEVDNLKNNSA